MTEPQEFQRIYRLTWLTRGWATYSTKVYEKVGRLKQSIGYRDTQYSGRNPVEGQDYIIEYADIPVYSTIWHPIEREEL